MMADQLHEDLVVKILERIRSLLRFTSVSKRWRSIILSDYQFTKSQFQIANCDQPSRTRLLLSTAASEPEYESLDWESPLDQDTITSDSVRKLTCPFKQPNDVVSILCSCNGLVLAYKIWYNLFIWNPSTGFFKKLPPYNNSNTLALVYFGFGYLSATDDYKVIVNSEVTVNSKDIVNDEHTYLRRKGQAEIFSWRANTWKSIHIPYSEHNFCQDGFLLHEALHWLSYKMHTSYDADINFNTVAFDLTAEEFQTIPLPTTFNSATDPCSFRGCLCVLDNAYGRNTPGSVDLWVMREYGDADSWAS